mmetsp:Transcript_36161/g.73585  ORF Transcript_36161/g.73585 Transcript_36161/m.73585 type:complete len:253 (-) Transcript_36161:362-1120(-)
MTFSTQVTAITMMLPGKWWMDLWVTTPTPAASTPSRSPQTNRSVGNVHPKLRHCRTITPPHSRLKMIIRSFDARRLDTLCAWPTTAFEKTQKRRKTTADLQRGLLFAEGTTALKMRRQIKFRVPLTRWRRRTTYQLRGLISIANPSQQMTTPPSFAPNFMSEKRTHVSIRVARPMLGVFVLTSMPRRASTSTGCVRMSLSLQTTVQNRRRNPRTSKICCPLNFRALFLAQQPMHRAGHSFSTCVKEITVPRK